MAFRRGLNKYSYKVNDLSKLSDSEGEAAETQVWLDYALKCGYIDEVTHARLEDKYAHIIAMLVNMMSKPENWSW